MIFELHRLSARTDQDWQEAHAVRLLYFNETLSPIEEKPHVLRIPVCLEDELCGLKKFLAFISPHILTSKQQWSQMCFLNVSAAGSNRVLIVVVIAALALALLAALFALFCRRNRKGTLMRIH